MAPKLKVKRKAEGAGLASVQSRKKQRANLESSESVPMESESVPTAEVSRSEPEAPASTTARSRVASKESVSSTDSGMIDTHASVAGPSSHVASESNPVINMSEETAASDLLEEEPSMSNSPKSPHEVLGKFANDWLEELDKDDTRSLALFLSYQLVHMFSFTETNAALYAAATVNKSDRTVRRWRSAVMENDGAIPESQQGRYQRSGVLWNNEELNKKASDYVRQNAAVKGRPNLTSIDFCRWVNDFLLPNTALEPEPGFPRKISIETARLWLHHVGFEVLTPQKGIIIDGHERPDVVEAGKLFLRNLTTIGSLHFTTAPTEEAAKAIPSVECTTSVQRAKTVVFSTTNPLSCQTRISQPSGV